MARLKTLAKLSTVAAAAAVAGCTSTAKDVPVSYLSGTVLDRNPISVAAQTEYLEVHVRPGSTQLSNADRARIEAFVIQYKRVGDGPLVMSLPAGNENSQSAIRGLAEARQIAYDLGVAYERISGGSYDAAAGDAPIIFAFRSYSAIAPDCPSMASVNMADVSSNNELPTLGCSVRANMAAMIAEPQDLLGERPLGEGDIDRRQAQMEKYRAGEPTGAQRSEDERGSVSSIGN